MSADKPIRKCKHKSKEEMQNIFLDSTINCPVIAAINNDERLEEVKKSNCEIVYILYGTICTIGNIVKEIKDAGKIPIVHIDLIRGLSNDEVTIDFIWQFTEADGIISTKPYLIKYANQHNIFTIQRFFMLDTLTYQNIKRHVHETNPDIVEMMPAGLTKMIQYAKEEVNEKPLVASGLILDKDDVMGALSAGSIAISTTNINIWKMMDDR